MFQIDQFRLDNKEVIHDVTYDYYGKRVATCSSDQTVKIWDLDENDQWSVSASWKTHSGTIWRISWAHPEFGQVIATCSFDRTVAIWEEIVGEKPSTSSGQTKRWVRRAQLTDSRTSITDCKFAPKTLGLMLATASTDGIIRIYEAPDMMNLSQWPVQHEIPCKVPLSCLTWNKSMYMLHSPLIAAGSDETSSAGGKVFIFEYSENSRKWSKIETINSISESVYDIAFAPNLGRTYHRLAVASKDLHILNIKPITESTGLSRLEVQSVAQFNDHYCQVWRVCWNITGTMLASSGDDGCIRIWKMNDIKSWICSDILKTEGLHPPLETPTVQHMSTENNSSTQQYKIYKRGNIITNATQVPWH
ncbi:nucleoporin seh1-like [Condylostylus longicornis]|uniref:nucleoporin seh1-like n=1 Tax=Condylostylus longicornis TaxID=2530218 RepID=UPI00244E5A5E|nr:nucleoporin seh1-like [Condylostylus longicornis]